MLCDIKKGLIWDRETETITNYGVEEIQCINEANFVYHMKMCKGEINLCQDHVRPFEGFAGTLIPV